MRRKPLTSTDVQGSCTYIIQMHIQCTNRFAEILPAEVESTELAVEDLAGLALLELFDSAIVDEVNITYSSEATTKVQECSIHLYARCPHHAFPSYPDEVAQLECALEDMIGCILMELFDTVQTNLVEVKFIPTEHRGRLVTLC